MMTMSLTPESKQLIGSIKKSHQPRFGNKSNQLFDELINKMEFAWDSVSSVTFAQQKDAYVDFEIDDAKIMRHLETYVTEFVCVSFRLPPNNQHICIHFGFENSKDTKNINKRMKLIVILFLFLQQYATIPHRLDIYIYLTSMKKQFPKTVNKILGWYEINTGLTYRHGNKIYIFRKEEWFKVLIHEAIHCIGIDFSGFDAKILKKYFHLNYNIHVNEAYTEFWAEVINIVIFASPNKNAIKELICYEIQFKFIQIQKILRYMNMSYDDFFKANTTNNFTEKSNVFAYYIITAIFMCQFEEFISWCYLHNDANNTLQSKNSKLYFDSLCRFIVNFSKSIKEVNPNHLFPTTLRMTCLEYI